MRTYLLLPLFLLPLLPHGASAQTSTLSVIPNLETSVSGAEVGTWGFWFFTEHRLRSALSLRAEAGVSTLVRRRDDTRTSFTVPVVSLEARWYYNLLRRHKAGKNTAGNSGNYLALRSEYHFVDAVNRADYGIDLPLVAPLWGMRRSFSSHWHADFACGPSFRWGQQAMNLRPYANLRFGYTL